MHPTASTPSPGREAASVHPLSPRVVLAWRLVLAAQALILLLILLAARPLLPEWVPVPIVAGIGVLVGAVLAALWPPYRYRAWELRLREADVLVRRGVLRRTVSVIPYGRVQHVDTRRGPLERWLGLATLVVFTAGIRGAETAVPGLPTAEAEALRDRLADLGGSGDAV